MAILEAVAVHGPEGFMQPDDGRDQEREEEPVTELEVAAFAAP